MKSSFALIGIGAVAINNVNAVGISTNEAELLKPTLTASNSVDSVNFPNPSAYQLELANGTTNVLNITKYLENAETGALTPKVYNVVFTNQLGNVEATGENVKYFKWAEDTENGGYNLVDGTSASHDLSVGLGDNVYVEQSLNTEGGAIYNAGGIISKLNGDFIGNSANVGGAIFNAMEITTLNGDFIDNWSFQGGAIFNLGMITTLNGDFIGNSADSGGAIFNGRGTISELTGDFIGNSSASGGAIYNAGGIISKLTGDFIGNSAGEESLGGAIFNAGEITTMTGDFIGNSASNDGGAIFNPGTITSLTGDFIGNSAGKGSGGGAIFNAGKITTLTGDFISNSAGEESLGGAILNTGEITTMTGDFIGNSAALSGAIFNQGKITTLTGDFIGNSASYAVGAIFNLGTIGILAKGSDVHFTGNSDSIDSNALYSEEGIFHLNAFGENKIVVNDGISGNSEKKSSNKLEINNNLDGSGNPISSDENPDFGVVEFNNKVENQTITVHNGDFKLGAFAGATITVNGEEKVVEKSIASLVNSDLTVLENGTLIIGKGTDNDVVSVDSDSSITLETGASIEFESGAKLFFDLADGDSLSVDAPIEFLTFATTADRDAYFETLGDMSSSDAFNVRDSADNLLADEDWSIVKNGDFGIAAIPEPATLGLLGFMSGAIYMIRRRFCA